MRPISAKFVVAGADEVGPWGVESLQNSGYCCSAFLVVEFDSNGVTLL